MAGPTQNKQILWSFALADCRSNCGSHLNNATTTGTVSEESSNRVGTGIEPAPTHTTGHTGLTAVVPPLPLRGARWGYVSLRSAVGPERLNRQILNFCLHLPTRFGSSKNPELTTDSFRQDPQAGGRVTWNPAPCRRSSTVTSTSIPSGGRWGERRNFPAIPPAPNARRSGCTSGRPVGRGSG